MGKSAIMAQMAIQHEEPATNNRNTGDLWVFHFCMHTQGRDTPIVAYRSLIKDLRWFSYFKRTKKNISQRISMN